MTANETSSNPPLDLTNMQEIAGENRQMVTTLIKYLLQEYPLKIDEIQRYLADKDAARLAASAHKLKGMIINYGAQQAHDLTFELERMGESGQLEMATITLDKLKQEFLRIEEYLHANDLGQGEYNP